MIRFAGMQMAVAQRISRCGLLEYPDSSRFTAPGTPPVDTALLREWLQLPAGPWPPETHTLLGLPTQGVTLFEAEQNAISRMELLRPHQLRHPELVTEGMNRLAQALLQFTAQPAQAPEPVATVVLDAEVIEDTVLVAKPPKRRSKRSVRPRNALREAYRDLAKFRRVRRAWADLRVILATPAERLVTAEVIARLSASRNLLLRHRSDRLEAHEAWTLMRSERPAPRIRSFSHEERQHLAADWDACRIVLETEYLESRQAISQRRPRSGSARSIHELTFAVGQNPEWILLALTVALIGFGWIRN